MIVAAAVCPQAPGLLPAVGQGVAEELGEVRAACHAAIDALVAARPDRIVVVGAGADGVWDESAGGSFRGFGPDVRAGGAEVVLPPSLTVGAWLLDAVDWSGPRRYATKLSETALGAADLPERSAVLVMADGSARHRMLAPEWADTEGRGWDAQVGRALADGDAAALAGLDLAKAQEYGACGVAGLVALGVLCADANIEARLRYDAAPFDVGYWVVDWQVSPA